MSVEFSGKLPCRNVQLSPGLIVNFVFRFFLLLFSLGSLNESVLTQIQSPVGQSIAESNSLSAKH